MAIITFWNEGKVEVGQTASIAATATNLAIKHNYKILIVNTKFNDKSFENSFWDKSNFQMKVTKGKTDLGTGITGLTKAISSNKTSPEIITNYTKIIFKNLELLTEESKLTEEEIIEQKKFLNDITKLANKYYDLVFVDLEGALEETLIKSILENSTVKVVSLTQRADDLDDYKKLKQNYRLLQTDNIIITINKYNEKSKYTIKNISKYVKEKEIFELPYNTLFFEASQEGQVADYVIKFRKANTTHLNGPFIASINKISEKIIENVKIQQMKLY